MDFLTALPTDVLHGIGLHITASRDLFSLSLANQRSRSVLTAPILFKWRLEHNGWDIELWEKSYPLESSEWIRIDHIHSYLEELFERAIADGSALTLLSFTTRSGGPLSSTNRGAEILQWLEDVSGLLPAVLLHHVSRNVPRLMQVKYWSVWKIMHQIVDDLCSQPTLPTLTSSKGPHRISSETLNLLSLGLALGSFSTEPTQIFEIVGNDHWSTVLQGPRPSSSSFFPRLSSGEMRHHRQTMGRRLSSVAVASSFLRIKLLADHARPRDSDSISFVTVPPPSPPLPGPDIANFRWIDVINPQTRRTSFEFSASEALKMGGPWFGYYSQNGRFDLMNMSIWASNADLSGMMLGGSGSDSVGNFALQGRIELAGGIVEMHKTYSMGFVWKWSGLVTPFGLVGTWGAPGSGTWGGWWWVWPQ